MKRILVISWYFPPINSSEGLVTYKLLKNSKYQYDVCMQDSNDSWSYGKNEQLPECGNVKKICLQGESLDTWKSAAVEYFRKHQNEYDIVMTRSMPPESHEIGLEIKKMKPGITWIASFGDPIANNPFVLKGMQTMSPYSLQMRYVRKMGIREMISPVREMKNLLWKLADRKLRFRHWKRREHWNIIFFPTAIRSFSIILIRKNICSVPVEKKLQRRRSYFHIVLMRNCMMRRLHRGAVIRSRWFISGIWMRPELQDCF